MWMFHQPECMIFFKKVSCRALWHVRWLQSLNKNLLIFATWSLKFHCCCYYGIKEYTIFFFSYNPTYLQDPHLSSRWFYPWAYLLDLGSLVCRQHIQNHSHAPMSGERKEVQNHWGSICYCSPGDKFGTRGETECGNKAQTKHVVWLYKRNGKRRMDWKSPTTVGELRTHRGWRSRESKEPGAHLGWQWYW